MRTHSVGLLFVAALLCLTAAAGSIRVRHNKGAPLLATPQATVLVETTANNQNGDASLRDNPTTFSVPEVYNDDNGDAAAAPAAPPAEPAAVPAAAGVKDDHDAPSAAAAAVPPAAGTNEPATEGRHVGHLAPVSDLHDEVACNAQGDMLYIKKSDTDVAKYAIAQCIVAMRGECWRQDKDPHTAKMTLNNCMPTKEELEKARGESDHHLLDDLAIANDEHAGVKIVKAMAIITVYDAKETSGEGAALRALKTMEDELTKYNK